MSPRKYLADIWTAAKDGNSRWSDQSADFVTAWYPPDVTSSSESWILDGLSMGASILGAVAGGFGPEGIAASAGLAALSGALNLVKDSISTPDGGLIEMQNLASLEE